VAGQCSADIGGWVLRGRRRHGAIGHKAGRDDFAETVCLRQQGVDHVWGGCTLSASQLVHQLFELVGAAAHLVQASDRRRAFDRVNLSEDGPDQRVVTAGLLELKQQLAELSEPHFGLLSEEGPDLLRAQRRHRPTSTGSGAVLMSGWASRSGASSGAGSSKTATLRSAW
jgi:hypothetical protein